MTETDENEEMGRLVDLLLEDQALMRRLRLIEVYGNLLFNTIGEAIAQGRQEKEQEPERQS